jgi:hypothetical protein
MVAVWTLFAMMVFIAKPVIVHKRFHAYALRDKNRAFR